MLTATVQSMHILVLHQNGNQIKQNQNAYRQAGTEILSELYMDVVG